MIKCKCLYDKKSITIYVVTAASITIISMTLLGYLEPVWPQWKWIDSNYIGMLLTGILIAAFMFLLFWAGAICIKSFCDGSEPRDHVYLLWAAILISAAILAGVILIPIQVGSYINYEMIQHVKINFDDNIKSYAEDKPISIEGWGFNCNDMKQHDKFMWGFSSSDKNFIIGTYENYDRAIRIHYTPLEC